MKKLPLLVMPEWMDRTFANGTPDKNTTARDLDERLRAIARMDRRRSEDWLGKLLLNQQHCLLVDIITGSFSNENKVTLDLLAGHNIATPVDLHTAFVNLQELLMMLINPAFRSMENYRNSIFTLARERDIPTPALVDYIQRHVHLHQIKHISLSDIATREENVEKVIRLWFGFDIAETRRILREDADALLRAEVARLRQTNTRRREEDTHYTRRREDDAQGNARHATYTRQQYSRYRDRRYERDWNQRSWDTTEPRREHPRDEQPNTYRERSPHPTAHKRTDNANARDPLQDRKPTYADLQGMCAKWLVTTGGSNKSKTCSDDTCKYEHQEKFNTMDSSTQQQLVKVAKSLNPKVRD